MSARALTLPIGARVALALVVVLAVAVGLGAALGWISWRFWVLGLAGIVLGVGLGWTLAVLTAWLGGLRRPALYAAIGALAGWLVLQVFEDANQRRAYRVALAETRAAETGLPPDEVARLIDTGGLDYLAADGDDILEGQVTKSVGFAGPTGRWVFRADNGVRLAGNWRAGRALPVGVAGVVVATLLELALATFIATRIARRAQPPSSSANGPLPV